MNMTNHPRCVVRAVMKMSCVASTSMESYVRLLDVNILVPSVELRAPACRRSESGKWGTGLRAVLEACLACVRALKR